VRRLWRFFFLPPSREELERRCAAGPGFRRGNWRRLAQAREDITEDKTYACVVNEEMFALAGREALAIVTALALHPPQAGKSA